MTNIEQLTLLYDILAEAKGWDPADSKMSPVELEIDYRIRNLLEQIAEKQATTISHGRSSEASMKRNLSLSRYKYHFRTMLKDLSDEEIAERYEEYKAEYCDEVEDEAG